MVERDHVYYIAALERIKKDLDPGLERMRPHYHEKGVGGYRWQLFSRTIFGFKLKPVTEASIGKILKLAANIYLIYFTAIVGVSASFSVEQFIQHPWAKYVTYALRFGVPAVAFILSYRANLTRMLTPGDPFFNLGAYKKNRPIEYEMFLSYLKDTFFSFHGLHGWVNNLYNEHSLSGIIGEYEKTNESLKQRVKILEDLSEQQTSDLKGADEEIDRMYAAMEKLIKQVKLNEDGYNTAIDLLFRLRRSDWSLFKRDDLRVISNYSLFEVIGDELFMIDELGTTETPNYIKVNDPSFAHYSSVQLVKNRTDIEYAVSDRAGRTVASYAIDVPSGKSLIYNFHINSDDTSLYDTINSKEMYRLIRVICMHLDERGLLERTGEHYGQA